jgi:hypothetical protein
LLRGLIRLGAGLLLGGSHAAAVWSHPLHSSLAELTLDPTRKSVVVSVRIFADDYDAVISRRIGSRTAPAAVSDSAAAGYLRSALTLAERDGRAIALSWQGTRRAGDLVWITLRGPAPQGLSGLQLQNRILFDLYADQINIVQAAYEGRRTSLLFTNGDGAKRLP